MSVRSFTSTRSSAPGARMAVRKNVASMRNGMGIWYDKPVPALKSRAANPDSPAQKVHAVLQWSGDAAADHVVLQPLTLFSELLQSLLPGWPWSPGSLVDPDDIREGGQPDGGVSDGYAL